MPLFGDPLITEGSRLSSLALCVILLYEIRGRKGLGVRYIDRPSAAAWVSFALFLFFLSPFCSVAFSTWVGGDQRQLTPTTTYLDDIAPRASFHHGDQQSP